MQSQEITMPDFAAAIAAFRPSVKPVVLLELDPEQAVSYPFPVNFSCVICLNVVWDPKECGECNQLFCSKCIDDWLSTPKGCPNCRSKGNERCKANRNVISVLAMQ